MVCDMSRFYKKHSGHVALAGQTGGAIRVVLDFFVSSERSRRIVSRQKKSKKNEKCVL